MKKTLLLFGVVVLLSCGAFTAFAQIPNSGFESWTSGNPDGWWTSNQPAPLSWLPISKSGTAHSGSSSLRGDVITIVTGSPYPPQIAAGLNMDGFAWTQRSANITGYYQFFPASGSGDRISVLGSLMKGGQNGTGVAVGGGYVSAAASSWTQFSVPFTYISANTPDWGALTFALTGPGSASAKAGSYFLLDDIAFSGTASAVGDLAALPRSFALEQNYPNPFNPSTKINFSVAQPGHVTLKVYNVLGTEVASLMNEQKGAGTFSVHWNAAGLPSGMYLCRLSVTSEKGILFDQTKKLTLLK
jgi:hypothetical protein